jgi:hypothetical protein
MSLSKMTLLAAGLALGFSTFGLSTTSYAQAQNVPGNQLGDVGQDEIIYLRAETGRFSKGKTKITDASHTKAMAGGARELPRGAMIYRKGGKLYLLENKPGKAAGKTMIAEEFQEHFDGNHQY